VQRVLIIDLDAHQVSELSGARLTLPPSIKRVSSGSVGVSRQGLGRALVHGATCLVKC
jgi:hypothetical protein